MECGVFTNGTFEFKDNKRKSVDIQHRIGNAFFVALYLELGDNPIVVAMRLCVVDGVDMQIDLAAVFPFQRKAVGDTGHDFFVGIV